MKFLVIILIMLSTNVFAEEIYEINCSTESKRTRVNMTYAADPVERVTDLTFSVDKKEKSYDLENLLKDTTTQHFARVDDTNKTANISIKIYAMLDYAFLFESIPNSYNPETRRFQAKIEGMNPNTQNYYDGFDELSCEIGKEPIEEKQL